MSTLSEELKRDHVRAIATAVAPITELWREALLIAGHPNIDRESNEALYHLYLKIHKMVDEAILVAELEAETTVRRGRRRRRQ